MKRATASLLVLTALIAVTSTLPFAYHRFMPPSAATVVVPVGWLRSHGFVAGFVQVVATSPGGFVERGLFVDLGRAGQSVEIRLPVTRLLGSLEAGTHSTHGVVDLGVVHVNLYLYRGDGSLWLSGATLDSLDYLASRTGDPVRAAEEARRDPAAVFKAGTVTFSADSFTPPVPLGKAIGEIIGPWLQKAVKDAGHPLPPPRSRKGLQPYYTLPPGTRLLLIDPGLKHSADSPPSGWLERIQPREAARKAWEIFANHYSYAVLIPKYYSLVDALHAAAEWYRLVSGTRRAPSGSAAYGIIDMDTFVNALLDDYDSMLIATWRNTMTPGTVIRHFDKAPIVFLNATCNTCPAYRHMEAIASFAFSRFDSVS
jgi:hypothetical protein